MKSVTEVKKKISCVKSCKSKAKSRDDILSYRVYCKVEAVLKWVLDEEVDLRRGKWEKQRRIKSD